MDISTSIGEGFAEIPMTIDPAKRVFTLSVSVHGTPEEVAECRKKGDAFLASLSATPTDDQPA